MNPSSRTLLASLAALGAVGVVGVEAAAASTPPPDDTIGADEVSAASEVSATSPFRIEVFMDASMPGFEIDDATPLMTGEVDGDRAHMVMDFGAIFGETIAAGEMPPELRGVDLTFETITSGSDVYIRAPILAALAGLSEDDGDDPTVAAFTQLGDGWGYIDGTQLPGFDAGALAGTLGVGGVDPTAMFDLLAGVEGAESIGVADIRGVSTMGVRADVGFAELLAAQGLPASSDLDALSGVTFPIEAWIDKDGFLRRIVIDMSSEALAEASEAAGTDIEGTLGDGGLTMTMEMFDYDAADIVIDVPTEFVDLTDAFAEIVPPQDG